MARATRPPTDASPRNIVICCDGTSNEIIGNLSNVLKLFRIAQKSDAQHVFYHPGVGTIANSNAWGRFKQNAYALFGLATGTGLDDNILSAYRYLSQVYCEGDRIFLFGFSRGAYTVRALAGFLQTVGLLWPDQLNIADYALTAYKKANDVHDLSIAWQFGRVTSTRRVPVHFVGVWDTVASIIVPRRDRFLAWPTLRTLPHTSTNPIVEIFRQAIAIDERRRLFRLNRWHDDQPFVANPFSSPPKTHPQDVKQVWFAGVHADIGGGYPETESALSKFPLIWMIEEAVDKGLKINRFMFNHLARGIAIPGGKEDYVAPDPAGMLHTSLRRAWWLLEIWPKQTKWREWLRPSFLGWYIPLGEPRSIPEGAIIHPSVQQRIAAVPSYRPVNVERRPRD